MRKIRTVIFLLVLGALALAASAGEAGYYIDGDTLHITSNCGNYHVASSRSSDMTTSPFECSTVTAIVVEEGVTEIGGLTFYGCNRVTSVSLPSTLKKINGEAFYSCSSLTSITIPASVTEIGSYAFQYCSGLTSVYFVGNVPAFGNYSYWHDGYITASYLPDNANMTIYTYSYANWTQQEISRLGTSLSWAVLNVTSGPAGPSATWYLRNDGVLQVNGTGPLYGYLRATAPWASVWSRIRGFSISSGITFDYPEGDVPSITYRGEPVNLVPGSSMTISDNYTVDASFFLPSNIRMKTEDKTVADVSDGVLTAEGLGETNLILYSATYPGIRTVVPVRVMNAVESMTLPARIYLARGAREILEPETISPETGYGELTWTLSETDAAVLRGNTLWATEAGGTATVTVTSWNGISASSMLHTYEPEILSVSIDPMKTRWGVGDETRISVSVQDHIRSYVNQLVSFTSGDETVATVDSEGMVRFLAEGEVTITVTADNGMADSVTLEVFPHTEAPVIKPIPVMFAGETLQAELNNPEQACAAGGLTWSSSDENVLTIDEDGLITVIGGGTATVTATTWDGVTGETEALCHSAITVVTIDEPEEPYYVLDTLQLTARVQCETELINEYVTWSSNMPATVSVNADGQATLNRYGSAVITATTVNGLTAQIVLTTGVWSEPEYTWSFDRTTVTAKRVCRTDSATETETKETSIRIDPPTEETAGRAFYVCDFDNPAFERQTAEIEIPALGTLSVMNLPAGLTAIDEETFPGLACEAVFIPDGCTAIGDRAFKDCSGLRYVVIPASVTSIGEDAFAGCHEDLVIYRK